MIKLILALVLAAIVGYLLGSINFAIIITNCFAKKDIRDFGSGNAGFTNVLRTLGKGPAVLTLLGDFFKGLVSVLIGYGLIFVLTQNADLLHFGGYAGFLAAVLGHMFPLYYHFKGGKGILTTAGALIVLNPPVLLIILSVFLIVVAFTKIVSLSSICAAVAFPISTILLSLLGGSSYIVWDAILSIALAALVIFMHRENIKRLLNGTEKKISAKKNKEQ